MGALFWAGNIYRRQVKWPELAAEPFKLKPDERVAVYLARQKLG